MLHSLLSVPLYLCIFYNTQNQIIVITFVMTFMGMTPALGAGIIVAMTTFALQSVQNLDPIFKITSATTLRSRYVMFIPIINFHDHVTQVSRVVSSTFFTNISFSFFPSFVSNTQYKTKVHGRDHLKP